MTPSFFVPPPAIVQPGSNPVDEISSKVLQQAVDGINPSLTAEEKWGKLQEVLQLLKEGADYKKVQLSAYGIPSTFFKVFKKIHPHLQTKNIPELMKTIFDLINQKMPELEYRAIEMILKEYDMSIKSVMKQSIIDKLDPILMRKLAKLIQQNQLDAILLQDPEVAKFLNPTPQ